MMFNKIIHYKKVESTNLLLSKLVGDEELNDNLVIVADYQTDGRGQRDKKWHSANNKNLLFSIYIKPNNFNVTQKKYFNMITSVSIIYTLKNYIKNSKIEIKSPNDILVDGCKISGILIETKIFKKKINRVIIGVGININQKKFPFKENKPTSINKILKFTIDKNEFLSLFLENFSLLFNFFKEKNYKFLSKEYLSFLKES